VADQNPAERNAMSGHAEVWGIVPPATAPRRVVHTEPLPPDCLCGPLTPIPDSREVEPIPPPKAWNFAEWHTLWVVPLVQWESISGSSSTRLGFESSLLSRKGSYLVVTAGAKICSGLELAFSSHKRKLLMIAELASCYSPLLDSGHEQGVTNVKCCVTRPVIGGLDPM
jgi:hypothetical protein